MSVTAVNRNTEVDARAQTKIDLAAAPPLGCADGIP